MAFGSIAWDGTGVIANCDGLSDSIGGTWAEDGGGGISYNTDQYLTGAGSIGHVYAAKSGFGYYTTNSTYDFGVSGTEENQFIYIWINISSSSAFDTLANNGFSFVVGTDTSNYRTYKLAGSGPGENNGWSTGWKLFVIDPTIAGSIADTGTFSLSTINMIGLWMDTIVSVRADTIFIDQVAIARGLRATNGTGTLDELVTYCAKTLSSRAWGVLQYKGRFFYSAGSLTIGDSTSQTSNTALTSSGAIVGCETSEFYHDTDGWILTHPDDYSKIVIEKHATYTTDYTATSTGYYGHTDARLSVTNDTGATINYTGGSFEELSNSTMNSDQDIEGTIYSTCGQIDTNGATLTNCVLTDTTASRGTSTATPDIHLTNNSITTTSAGLRYIDDEYPTVDEAAQLFTGQMLDFDDTYNEYINLGDQSISATSLTLVASINMTAIQDSHSGVIAKWHVGGSASSSFLLNINDDVLWGGITQTDLTSAEDSLDISALIGQHLTIFMVADEVATTVKLFVFSEGTWYSNSGATYDGTINNPTYNLMLGRFHEINAYTFDGLIGDAQIWTEAMTQDDMDYVVANPEALASDRSASSLVSGDLWDRWHMAEGQGSTIFGVNGHDGTATSFNSITTAWANGVEQPHGVQAALIARSVTTGEYTGLVAPDTLDLRTGYANIPYSLVVGDTLLEVYEDTGGLQHKVICYKATGTADVYLNKVLTADVSWTPTNPLVIDKDTFEGTNTGTERGYTKVFKSDLLTQAEVDSDYAFYDCIYNGGTNAIEGSLKVNSSSEAALVTVAQFKNYSSNGKYAVFVDSAVTSFTMDNWQFDDPNNTTDYALYWAGTSGTLTITRTNGTNLVEAGCTTAGGSVSIPLNTVSLTINVLDEADSSALGGAAVTIKAAATGNLPYNDSVTITRSGNVATVSHTGHGLLTGHKVAISGAVQNDYNRIKTITLVDANSYTYAVYNTPTTPATGTITATAVIIDGITDVSGIISDTRSYTGDQAFTGLVQRGTGTDIYKARTTTGTLDTANGASQTILLTKD